MGPNVNWGLRVMADVPMHVHPLSHIYHAGTYVGRGDTVRVWGPEGYRNSTFPLVFAMNLKLL